jgi:4-carboxymuconolactone decarboxylase
MGDLAVGAELRTDHRSLVGLSAALGLGVPEGVERRLAEAAEHAAPSAVEETILQSYLFVGFPGALNALVSWRRLRPETAPRTEGSDDPARWAARGERVCREVYGTAYEGLRHNVASLHPDVDQWMLKEGYGKVIGRPGLELAVRELCIVATLAVQHAPRQLHSHLRGALQVGAGPRRVEQALSEALAEAVRQGNPAADVFQDTATQIWSRVRARHEARSDPSHDFNAGQN